MSGGCTPVFKPLLNHSHHDLLALLLSRWFTFQGSTSAAEDFEVGVSQGLSDMEIDQGFTFDEQLERDVSILDRLVVAILLANICSPPQHTRLITWYNLGAVRHLFSIIPGTLSPLMGGCVGYMPFFGSAIYFLLLGPL